MNYSPVEIVEEGEDKKGELAPGLLQAEFERVSVHHRRRVVEQLLRVSWGMEVPTTERKHHTTGSSPIPEPAAGGGKRKDGETMGGNGTRNSMDKDAMMSSGDAIMTLTWVNMVEIGVFLKSQF